MAECAPIDDVREVAARLRAGELGDVGLRFACRLDAYLEHAPTGMTLDQAIGVKPASGGSPWWIENSERRRDEILRAYMQRFCNGSPEALGGEMRSYERGQWKRDRRLPEMPPAYPGTPRELLYLAYRENESIAPDGMPTSGRQLRRRLVSDWGGEEKRGQEVTPFPVTPKPRIVTSQLRKRDHAPSEETSIAPKRRRQHGRR